MFHETAHLSDQEILQVVDGELPQWRRSAIQKHLDSCSLCRARLDKVQATLSEFVQLHRDDAAEARPSADRARDLLLAKLAQAARRRRSWLGVLDRVFLERYQWAAVAGALVLVTASVWILWREVRSEEAPSVAAAQLSPIPDPRLTPGAVLPVTRAEVCRVDGEGETHAIPVAMRRRVLQEYRTPESHAAEYEVDFLITPGLGGADDVQNLWPEPYSAMWNARVKDELEDRLHEMVCAGELDLSTAQRDIANDWISAYKKYFHTNTPLPPHGGFASDRL